MTSLMEVAGGQQPALREASLVPEEKLRVGKLIARLRRRKKLSQHGLSRRIGVSRSHLCNVEAGRSRASATQLVAIAKTLGTSVDAILDGPDAAPAPPPTTVRQKRENSVNSCSLGFTREEQMLMLLYRDLAEHEQERIAGEIVQLIAQTKR